MNIAIAIHGGAGNIRQAYLTEDMAECRHERLRKALRAGWVLLRAQGSALDAVTAAVCALEDDPLFNGAHGAARTDVGTTEMDAAIMDGEHRRAGAVAGICGPRSPILVARAVMETTPHLLLIGEGAHLIARTAGHPFESAKFFETPSSRAALHRELERRAANAPGHRSDADCYGTVGAVARDSANHFAAATSTVGITAKLAGRLGNTPIIAAGTFADDATCAVSCTGTGEVFIRYTAAAEIAARMPYKNETLEYAAAKGIAELARQGRRWRSHCRRLLGGPHPALQYIWYVSRHDWGRRDVAHGNP